MNWKKLAAEYGLPIALLVALLTLLPPIMVPYFGFAGTYITYAVTAVVCGIALWVSKRIQPHIE